MSEIVRMGLIRRKADLSSGQFRAHWRGPHGTLASAMPNLLGYHQNHRIENYPLAGFEDRWNLDGLSELWFPSLDAMRAAVASPAYTPVANDTPDVMTMPGIIAGLQAARLPEVSSDASCKLMLIATCKAAPEPADLAAAWNGAELVAGLDSVLGVVDMFVTHRELAPGVEVPRQALPIDIVVEFLFDDETGLGEAAGLIAQALRRGTGRALANASLYGTQTLIVVRKNAMSENAGV